MCKTKKELNELVHQHQKLSAEKKKIEERLKKVNDEIIEYAQKKGEKGGKGGNTYIVFGDDYKVSCIIVTQYRYDSKKLDAYLEDLASQFKNPTTFPKLDIR